MTPKRTLRTASAQTMLFSGVGRGGTMKRREFVGLLGGAAVWPVTARVAAAQQRARFIVGFLGPQVPGFGHYLDDVASALKQFGYQQGRDYVFEERYAEGDMTRLPALAEDLVRLKPNVIIAPITVAALAVRLVGNPL